MRVPKKLDHLGEIKITGFFSPPVLSCIISSLINWRDVFVGDKGTFDQNQMFLQLELEATSPDTQGSSCASPWLRPRSWKTMF